MPELDEETIEELREAFQVFDADGNGRIDFEEFVRFMEDLDAGMSELELEIGFSEVDIDGTGFIDFDEFIAWWEEQ